MIYIGIDPGKNGGICELRTFPQHREMSDNLLILPYSDENLIEVCTSSKEKHEPIKCVLEKVNAMPGQGVVSMFNFGQNFGFIQGVLKACEIPFELVPPQKWKKEFSVTGDKNTSIEVAKRLFPGVQLKASTRCTKDHDGMAEALLMAEYARRRL